MTAAAISVLAAMPEAVIAAPITSDFTGTVAGNQALTGSHVYTAVGGPNLTAISGSYTHAGSRQPAANDAFTAGGQLVGNNRPLSAAGIDGPHHERQHSRGRRRTRCRRTVQTALSGGRYARGPM
jgi:hypothetical protein